MTSSSKRAFAGPRVALPSHFPKSFRNSQTENPGKILISQICVDSIAPSDYFSQLISMSNNTQEMALVILNCLQFYILNFKPYHSQFITQFTQIFNKLIQNPSEIIKRSTLPIISFLINNEPVIKSLSGQFNSWTDDAKEIFLSFAFCFQPPQVLEWAAFMQNAKVCLKSDNEGLASTANDFIEYMNYFLGNNGNAPKIRNSMDLTKEQFRRSMNFRISGDLQRILSENIDSENDNSNISSGIAPQPLFIDRGNNVKSSQDSAIPSLRVSRQKDAMAALENDPFYQKSPFSELNANDDDDFDIEEPLSDQDTINIEEIDHVDSSIIDTSKLRASSKLKQATKDARSNELHNKSMSQLTDTTNEIAEYGQSPKYSSMANDDDEFDIGETIFDQKEINDVQIEHTESNFDKSKFCSSSKSKQSIKDVKSNELHNTNTSHDKNHRTGYAPTNPINSQFWQQLTAKDDDDELVDTISNQETASTSKMDFQAHPKVIDSIDLSQIKDNSFSSNKNSVKSVNKTVDKKPNYNEHGENEIDRSQLRASSKMKKSTKEGKDTEMHHRSRNKGVQMSQQVSKNRTKSSLSSRESEQLSKTEVSNQSNMLVLEQDKKKRAVSKQNIDIPSEKGSLDRQKKSQSRLDIRNESKQSLKSSQVNYDKNFLKATSETEKLHRSKIERSKKDLKKLNKKKSPFDSSSETEEEDTVSFLAQKPRPPSARRLLVNQSSGISSSSILSKINNDDEGPLMETTEIFLPFTPEDEENNSELIGHEVRKDKKPAISPTRSKRASVRKSPMANEFDSSESDDYSQDLFTGVPAYDKKSYQKSPEKKDSPKKGQIPSHLRSPEKKDSSRPSEKKEASVTNSPKTSQKTKRIDNEKHSYTETPVSPPKTDSRPHTPTRNRDSSTSNFDVDISQYVSNMTSNDWEEQQKAVEVLTGILTTKPSILQSECRTIWMNLLDIIVSPRTMLSNAALGLAEELFMQFSQQLVSQTPLFVDICFNLSCNSRQFIADGATNILVLIAQESPRNKVLNSYIKGTKHKNPIARAKASQCLSIMIDQSDLEYNEFKQILTCLTPLIRDNRTETRSAAKEALKKIINDERFGETAKQVSFTTQDYKELMKFVQS